MSACRHAGSAPLRFDHHKDGIDWCRCVDCGELVAMEPCCEWCGDTHMTCDQCGEPASAKTCGSCGSLVCEIEAMHVGDEREARGLLRVATPLPTRETR